MRQGDRQEVEEANMTAGRDSDVKRRGHPTARSPGVGVLAALEASPSSCGTWSPRRSSGGGRLRWGTRGAEASASLPGDELVRRAQVVVHPGSQLSTHARRLCGHGSPRSDQGRGGFYTYQTLENIVGCRITNTTEILPEHQASGGRRRHLPASDRTADANRARGSSERPRAPRVTRRHRCRGGWGVSTWQFAVNPGADGGSRLLTRGRSDHTPDWRSRLAFGRFPHRSDHLRDEPQDDARDQATGGARRPVERPEALP